MKSTFDLRPEELFRLFTAYMSIRSPQIRREFLRGIEDWSRDQWTSFDYEKDRPA